MEINDKIAYIKQIKETAPRYVDFCNLWRQNLAATSVKPSPVIDAIVAGSTPRAHAGESAASSTIREYGDKFWVEHNCGRYSKGTATLALEAEVSEPTVKRKVAELQRAGLVRVVRRKRTNSQIVLLVLGKADYDDWLAYNWTE